MALREPACSEPPLSRLQAALGAWRPPGRLRLLFRRRGGGRRCRSTRDREIGFQGSNLFCRKAGLGEFVQRLVGPAGNDFLGGGRSHALDRLQFLLGRSVDIHQGLLGLGVTQAEGEGGNRYQHTHSPPAEKMGERLMGSLTMRFLL